MPGLIELFVVISLHFAILLRGNDALIIVDGQALTGVAGCEPGNGVAGVGEKKNS